MNNNTQNTQITVFYGDQPAHAHERRAINVVRNELARRGISATLLVNFTIRSRQIDLLIVTEQRCMNVELKHVDVTLPLIAKPNGLWRQQLPDGTERMLDRNYYEQARQETYALSDLLEKLARKRLVPGPQHSGFAKHIDTVVCCDPHIPAGSALTKHPHVAVVGLDTLLDRLAQPGPGFPHWAPQHWEEAIRCLGLYPEGQDAEDAVRRRADAAAVEDYRRHFRELKADGLPRLVPAAALIDRTAAVVDAAALADILTPGHLRMVLAGESGQGKTHLAKHTAMNLTDRGQMVVWIDADDYRKGQLGQSLRRAVSPFSTQEAHSLLAKAAEGGSGITFIIDALEKCPHSEKLLEQLHALQNQYPAAILITTTKADTPQLAATCRVDLAAPAGPERVQIATTYGTSDRVAESEEYRTRLAITLASQVISDLPPGADSNTEVLAAYIRRLAPSETVRAGLRCLAQAMNDGVRTALPIAEAMTALHRYPALATTPSAIDDILDSPLVQIHQGRLRFDHENFARFLAAHHLVLTATDGAALAQLLNEPAHRDLRDHAILLESDPTRRYDTLRELAVPALLAAAANGAYGPDTEKLARADITELLVHATAIAPESTFSVEDPTATSLHGGTWHHARRWTPIENALLLAAGRCAYGGMFLPEIGALMDATDIAARAAMRDLQAAGSRVAISTVVACTYGAFSHRTVPAAGIVIQGVEEAQVFDREDTDVPTATLIWRPKPRCYGRLYLAAHLSHPIRHPEDARNLPDLVETGLAAGGYHLRLELLQSAQFGCGVLESDTRQRMIDVLNSYDTHPSDIGTNSALIETLASYDQIDPVTSLEGIHREITNALSDVDNPLLHRLANGIVAAMFEDERVLGPYTEAVESLPDEQRLTLYAMSVMAPDYSFGTGWALRQLVAGVQRADDLIGRALARYAGPLPHDPIDSQQAVSAHLYGLQGWAKISSTLPPAAESTDPDTVTWRLVDELLLPLLRGSGVAPGRTETIWATLGGRLAAAATTLLNEIYRADIELADPGVDGPRTVHDMLLHTYPDQIRELMEWALIHRDELPAERWDPMGGARCYAVRTLGAVGTAQTADLLRHHYVHDSELGRDAVAAVHAIDARTQPEIHGPG